MLVSNSASIIRVTSTRRTTSMDDQVIGEVVVPLCDVRGYKTTKSVMMYSTYWLSINVISHYLLNVRIVLTLCGYKIYGFMFIINPTPRFGRG